MLTVIEKCLLIVDDGYMSCPYVPHPPILASQGQLVLRGLMAISVTSSPFIYDTVGRGAKGLTSIYGRLQHLVVPTTNTMPRQLVFLQALTLIFDSSLYTENHQHLLINLSTLHAI
jgi:hypothetical protein